MHNPDARIWGLLDRAANHLILARFGRHSEVARIHLYRRAAAFLMMAASAVLERAGGEATMEEAERMVSRERW